MNMRAVPREEFDAVCNRAKKLLNDRGGSLPESEFERVLLDEFPNAVEMRPNGLGRPCLHWAGKDTCSVQYSLGWARHATLHAYAR